MEHSALLNYMKEQRFNFTLQSRLDETKAFRRSCRTSVALHMRNIGPMTPIHSPVKPTKVRSKTPTKPNSSQQNMLKLEKKEEHTNERMQKFKKWQKEKQKRLQEEKEKAKPPFKVHHVKTTASYNLEPIYNTIKGKPIDVFRKKNNKAEFVPIGKHKFKPPPNVKTINPHHMNLRSRNVVSDFQTSKKGGIDERNPMPAKKKMQKLPEKKIRSKTTNSVTIQGKTLQVITENIKLDGKVISKPQKKLPLVTTKPISKQSKSKISNTGGILKEVNEAIQVNGNSDNLERNEKPTLRRKSFRNDDNQAVSPQKSSLEIKKSKRQQTRDFISTEEDSLSSSDEFPSKNEKRNKRSKRKMTLMEQNKNNSSLSTAYSIDENSSLSDSPITPKTNNMVTYVSPFVTMSRGKENARREHSRRSILGGGNDTKCTSPRAAAQYFRQILEQQNQHLLSLCTKWNAYKLENETEEVHNMINVAIGQTELLLKKKFKQFQELIELCESGKSEKPIKSLDLHGYYDTMQIQIVNLEKRFENLEQLKANDWEEIVPTPKKPVSEKNVPSPKKAKLKKAKKQVEPSMGLRAMIAAKRKQKTTSIPDVVINAVQTPKSKRMSNLRKSMGASLQKKRVSSPGLIMMKVTQDAKTRCSSPGTLPKSILKSEKKVDKNIRKSKMVLFQESPTSSPPRSKMLRRSSRKFDED